MTSGAGENRIAAERENNLRALALRIVAAVMTAAVSEGLLPPGNMAKSARLVLALAETVMVTEPILRLLPLAG